MSLEARLQAASTEYQKIQDDPTNIVGVRQQLDAQLSETLSVKKEFETLKPENTVYKLIGPGLVIQDREEAKQNVAKRLDYFKAEIERNEAKIKKIQESAEVKKNEIVAMQNAAQTQQQQAGDQAITV